jgi:MFS family permease
VRLFSGRLSDRLPRRLPVVIAGYGLSALTKPLFALASGATMAGVLRFADRVGKGVRTPPRDALLAGAAAEGRRGFAFGVHRAADSTGAVLGVLSAALVISMAGGVLTAATFRTVVLVAAVPAALAVVVLLLIREAPHGQTADQASVLPPLGSTAQRRYLLAVAIFAIGNSSDAFIVLRLVDLGATASMALILLAVMNAAHVLVAIPGGHLSDRVGRRRVLFGGYLAFAIVYGALGFASSLPAAVVLMVLYGAYYGVTDGVSRAFLADLAPAASRGGAYGWYHMAVGLGALPASIIAGWLWTQQGPAAAFLWGSVCALLAMAVLATVSPRPAA